jgi:hypothetical protein
MTERADWAYTINDAVSAESSPGARRGQRTRGSIAIDYLVMAITSAEAVCRHAASHRTPGLPVEQGRSRG